jgi:hypothetical protein
MLAHIAGVPFEEWLAPLAAIGSGISVALRAAIHRQRKPERSSPTDSRRGHGNRPGAMLGP